MEKQDSVTESKKPYQRQLKGAAYDMFGFIWTQPIHKSLRQMRIANVAILLVSVDIMYSLVGILEKAGELSPGQTVAAVGALAGGVVASIWKGISSLSDKNHGDE